LSSLENYSDTLEIHNLTVNLNEGYENLKRTKNFLYTPSLGPQFNNHNN